MPAVKDPTPVSPSIGAMNSWPGYARMQSHQILLYLLAIAAGVLTGLALPAAAPALQSAINPFLALLLYATFLSMPLTKLAGALGDIRFMGALMLANFVSVPLVVFALTRFIAHDKALLFGVLLVLLAPCVDYVIVFTGLAGGDSHKLLAATPLLLVSQVLLLPVFMYLFAGPATTGLIEPEPFVRSLLGLIVLPLAAAAITQMITRKYSEFAVVGDWADYLMVPLMMGTLFSVVGSQIHGVAAQISSLFQAIMIFALFILLMVFIAWAIGRIFKLGIQSLRAVAFSGVTRNSLVVLPLALALPVELAFASTVVVTQTLVELLGMLLMVRFIPALIRQKSN